MTLAESERRLAAEIQRRCAKKWPESVDKSGSLSLAVTRITGKANGLHSLTRITRAYESGRCCLLLLRDIARALDCTMADLTNPKPEPAPMTHIYELTGDHGDEYWSLGVFASFDDIRQLIASHDGPDGSALDELGEHGETLEIRRRTLGQHSSDGAGYATLATIEREQEYDEIPDEYAWASRWHVHHPCEICDCLGTAANPVTDDPDPYAAEMTGDNSPRWLCDQCREGLCRDI